MTMIARMVWEPDCDCEAPYNLDGPTPSCAACGKPSVQRPQVVDAAASTTMVKVVRPCEDVADDEPVSISDDDLVWDVAYDDERPTVVWVEHRPTGIRLEVLVVRPPDYEPDSVMVGPEALLVGARRYALYLMHRRLREHRP